MSDAPVETELIPDRMLKPTWLWLHSTEKLQRDHFKIDLDLLKLSFADGVLPSVRKLARQELCRYLDWNSTAAVQELAEVREEFAWKPWTVDEPFIHRERVLDEIVDVMHFLGNMLVGMGVDDVEFERRYIAKQRKNEERQASGTYSALKGGLAEGSDL